MLFLNILCRAYNLWTGIISDLKQFNATVALQKTEVES